MTPQLVQNGSNTSNGTREKTKEAIKTVTVDIFDTILRRKVWPEDLQFLVAAKSQSKHLKLAHGIEIAPFEFFEMRIEARSIILRRNQELYDDNQLVDVGETSIRDWFRTVIELVMLEKRLEIEEHNLSRTVTRLVEIELEVESRNLAVNRHIKKRLEDFQNAGIRIFFLSDMYLSSEDIQTLLEKKGLLHLFESGFTSGDQSMGKHSGKLFQALANGLIPGFSLGRNLHIGDNRLSDYIAPISLGSSAFHYRSIRNYTIRPSLTFIGKLIVAVSRLSQRAKIIRKIQANEGPRGSVAFTNFLFSALVLAFLKRVKFMVRNNPDSAYVFVSAEGPVLLGLYESIFGPCEKNIVMAEGVNRRASLAYLFSIYSEKGLGSPGALLYETANTESYEPLLDLIKLYGSDLTGYPVHVVEAKELSSLMKKLSQKKLSKVAHPVTTLLSKVDGGKFKKIVLVDLGWGGTIEGNLRLASSLLGKKTLISGLYLGFLGYARAVNPFSQGVVFSSLKKRKNFNIFLPVVWEHMFSTSTAKKPASKPDLLSQMLEHVKRADAMSPALPKSFTEATSILLSRELTRPSTEQAIYYGSISDKRGLEKTSSFSVVPDFSNSRQYWKGHLKNPHESYRILADSRHWPEGAAKIHRIPFLYLVRPIKWWVKRSRNEFG